MNKIYYTIYKITNQVNDKIYIGAHVTSNVNDDYMGSGRALNSAKKKYGIENFTKETLYIFDTEKEMWDKEYEIVNEEFCNRKDTYNIRTGGVGGWNHWNDGGKGQKEACSRGGKKAADKLNKFMQEQKSNNTEWWQNWIKKVTESNRSKNNNAWLNVSEEESSRRKNKISSKMSGAGNSQFGRYWISNISTKEVRRIKNNEEIPVGWVRGKTGKDTSKIKDCWINDGIKENLIPIEKKQEYLDKGFISGRLKKSLPQNKIL